MPAVAQAAPVAGWAAAEAVAAVGVVTEAVAAVGLVAATAEDLAAVTEEGKEEGAAAEGWVAATGVGWVAAERLQYQESCIECRQRVCTRQGPYPGRAGMDRTSYFAATYSGRTK